MLRNLVCCRTGRSRARNVSGLDEAGDTEVKLLVDPGRTIGALESSDSRVAYVRAVGKTADLDMSAVVEWLALVQFILVAPTRLRQGR